VVSFDSDLYPNAPQPGTYFVSTTGDYEKISSQVFSEIMSFPEIIGFNLSDETAYHILSDGSIRRIGPADAAASCSPSPNKKWFLVEHHEGENHYKWALYDDAYQPINSWMLAEYLTGTAWRPDSAGLFLFTMNSVYYLEIPDGKPHLLLTGEDCEGVACRSPDFTWLP
jgi:hypothetical protein